MNAKLCPYFSIYTMLMGDDTIEQFSEKVDEKLRAEQKTITTEYHQSFVKLWGV